MSFTLEEKADPLFAPAEVIIELPPEPEIAEGKSKEISLDSIKSDLVDIIEAMKKNKSIFSMMADFWGSKPWWLKTIIGLVVLVPLTVTAVLLQLYWLVGFGIFLTLLYTGFSLLLDNHQSLDKESVEELERGVFAIADFMIKTTNHLEKVSNLLEEQVGRLGSENTELGVSVQNLTGNNEEINGQLERIKALNHILSETNVAIKASEEDLRNLLAKEKDRLLASEAQRQNTQEEYNQNLVHLQAKIQQLQDINTSLETEFGELQAKCEILLTSNQELIRLNAEEEVQRKSYYEQVQETLQDKDQKIHQAVDTFSDAANTMQDSANKFKSTLEESANLLSQGVLSRGGRLFDRTGTLPLEAEGRKNAYSNS